VSTKKSARTKLDRMLDQRNEHPERITAIDAQIRDTFEQKVAVLVLDMCGFSRLTVRHGIIHYLAMIRRMQCAVVPLITEHRGRVIKVEADNLFATFPQVSQAIAAARAIHASLAQANAVLPADWDVHVGIGIGYGPLLLVGTDDVYGAEMNLASKLGEDTAKAGEVLLTEAAHARAGRERSRFKARRTRIGKLRLSYYAWPG